MAVESIQRYNQFVREKMVTLAANTIPDDIESYVFRDGPALLEIKRRLEFLEFILSQHTSSLLNNEKLLLIWEIYVNKANFEFETKEFLDWLQKERYYADLDQGRFFSNQERFFIFKEILCKPVYEEDKLKIEQNLYATFKKYFFLTNEKVKSIHCRHEQILGVDFDLIEG